jgi:hypothetical protein
MPGQLMSRPSVRGATVIPGSPATASLRRQLTELGESGRTGALHIHGRPGGVIYLIAGRIVYAESPACPGLGERLIGSGRVPARAWRTAYATGRGSHRVGQALLRAGVIGLHELALRVVAAIGDATCELLQSEEAPVRFVPGERHWLGEFARLQLGPIGHVAAQRLRTAPPPSRPRRGGTGVSRPRSGRAKSAV